MSGIIETIANNFRLIREERRLSLDAVAKMTGVSKSMLAQIERGDVSPTVVTLRKLADGLKVPFTELINQKKADLEIVDSAAAAPVTEDGGRFRNYPLFPFDEERRFEVYLIELEPGCVMHADAHQPGTEEFLTVFSGSLFIETRGESRTVPPGSAVRFLADLPHTYGNSGNETCRLSMIIYYPRR